MHDDHATAPAVAPEQGGGAAEELAYSLRQQQLTAEYGRFALRTHDTAALLQEATRVCALWPAQQVLQGDGVPAGRGAVHRAGRGRLEARRGGSCEGRS